MCSGRECSLSCIELQVKDPEAEKCRGMVKAYGSLEAECALPLLPISDLHKPDRRCQKQRCGRLPRRRTQRCAALEQGLHQDAKRQKELLTNTCMAPPFLGSHRNRCGSPVRHAGIGKFSLIGNVQLIFTAQHLTKTTPSQVVQECEAKTRVWLTHRSQSLSIESLNSRRRY